MPALRTGGMPLGRATPSQDAAEWLRRFTKSLGKNGRVTIEANSASVTIKVQLRAEGGDWQTERTVQQPTAIDAIKVLIGPAPAPPKLPAQPGQNLTTS